MRKLDLTEPESIKILWVDDHIGQFLPHIVNLEKNGFEVTGAISRETACDLLENQMFDIIVSDLLMPPPINPIKFLKFAHDKCSEATICIMSSYLENAEYQRSLGSLSIKPRLVSKDILNEGPDVVLNQFVNLIPKDMVPSSHKENKREFLSTLGKKVLDATDLKLRIPGVASVDIKKLLGL